MILVDTSVWIDHLRRSDARLAAFLAAGVVMTHPFVIGELACGWLPQRKALLADLAELPTAPVASHEEALDLLDRHQLVGRGIGWVDVHLVAAAMLAGRAPLWTRDRRLRKIAGELGLSLEPARR